ncbi:hypothetical protein B0H21DRAFT_823318 [Amylocystis lapponica]|nr:hypothetical protein B0H21DRAFT_823318 [Amylocystis lapponica]
MASKCPAAASDAAERQAVLAVVHVWLNRLSLVSGITTFFASLDSLLFSLASAATHAGQKSPVGWSAVDKLTTASFAGALIFHVCSAITAFAGSFVLIRLELLEADDDEERALSPSLHTPDTPPPSAAYSATLAPHARPSDAAAPHPLLARVAILVDHPLSLLARRKPVRARTAPPPSARADTLDAPVQVLARCLKLAVAMAVLGFALGVLGILAYAWTATPLAVSVFSTVCLGVCVAATVIVLSW